MTTRVKIDLIVEPENLALVFNALHNLARNQFLETYIVREVEPQRSLKGRRNGNGKGAVQ
jgi:hypothetical protein